MQRFHFSLDRVLHFRRLERDLEKAQLEKLAQTFNACVHRHATLSNERLSIERGLATGLSIQGRDVATLSLWQSSVRKNLATLQIQQAQAEANLVAQQTKLRGAERNLQLLEKLRERQLFEWTAADQKEQEDFAAEMYLARTVRNSRNH